MAAALSSVLLTANAAQAVAGVEPAPRAPVPDCAGTYASAVFTQYLAEQNLFSFDVNVNNLPFGSTSDIYTTVNSGDPINWSTQEGFASGTRSYVELGAGASILISIYNGEYQVCGGSLYVVAPGTGAR